MKPCRCMTKNEAEKLKSLTEKLGIHIKDLQLLKTALTHRSYLNEYKRGNLQNNERLEYLGDAVLELLVSKHLYDQYPDKPEGDLTSFRAATVRTESLAEEALKLDLGEHIFMSKGEEQTGGRTRPYILANTFEAVVGAIYLDQGIAVTLKFLRKSLFYKIPEIVEKRLDIDSKSKIQEISQEVLHETPTYEIVGTKGPDHEKTFTSKIVIKGHDFGHGTGKSKQEAEQNAALAALDNWKDLISKYFNID